MPPRRRRRHQRGRAPCHGGPGANCASDDHAKPSSERTPQGERGDPDEGPSSGADLSHPVAPPSAAPPHPEQVRRCHGAFLRVLLDDSTTPREKYAEVTRLISGGAYTAALLHAPVLHAVMKSKMQDKQKAKVVLKLVTECHVCPRTPDADGTLPLHIAAYTGLWQVMRAMVHHGADVSRHCVVRELGCDNNEEFQPIHCAAYRGNAKAFRELCDLGASLQGQSTPYGDFPVHMVCAYNPHPEEFLEYMMQVWPRCVAVMCNQGFNCLHCAIIGQNTAAAAFLLRHHPELAGSFTKQEPRFENVSALTWAVDHITALSREHECIQLIGMIARQTTCDIGARGSRGTSPLDLLLKNRTWHAHVLEIFGEANPDYGGLEHAERNFVQAEIASARLCRDSGTLPRIPFVNCSECEVVLRLCFLAIENCNKFALVEELASYTTRSFPSSCCVKFDYRDHFLRHCIRAGNSAAVDYWIGPCDMSSSHRHDPSFVALAVEYERHMILKKLILRDYAYPRDALHRTLAQIAQNDNDAEVYEWNLRRLLERQGCGSQPAECLNLAHLICHHNNRAALSMASELFPEFGALVTTASSVAGRLPIHFALDQLYPDLDMLRQLWAMMLARGWVASKMLELSDEGGISLLCTIVKRNACDGAWHWMRAVTNFRIHDIAHIALDWVSANPRGGPIARILMGFSEIRCHARDGGTPLHSCHRQRNAEPARAIVAETCTHLAAANGAGAQGKGHGWVVLTLSDVLGWHALHGGATQEHSNAGDSDGDGIVLWLLRNECASPRAALEGAIVMGHFPLLRALLSLDSLESLAPDAWCPDEGQLEPVRDNVAHARDAWQELQVYYNMQNGRLSALLDLRDLQYCCEACARRDAERVSREHEERRVRRHARLIELRQLALRYLKRENASMAPRAYIEHRRSTAQIRLLFRHLRTAHAASRKFRSIAVRVGMRGRLASMKDGILDHPRNLSAIHKWARGRLRQRLERSENEAMQLGTELEDISDTFLCMICAEGHRDVTYLCNGFHLVYCRGCFDKMSLMHGIARSCPICRQNVTQVGQRNRGIIAEFGQWP